MVRTFALVRPVGVAALILVAAAVGATPAPPQFTTVTTIAGGRTTQPVMHTPQGLAIDPRTGVVFIADTKNHQIKTLTPSGVLAILAGSGVPGLIDGTGIQARFHEPAGLAFDAARESLYVADRHNHAIRRIAKDGSVTTVAGTGKRGFVDGSPAVAQFDEPAAVVVAADGTLYVADAKNSTIRRVGSDGLVSTIAGTGRAGFADGAASFARFAEPQGIAIRADGALLVADAGNHRIRIIAGGIVSTVAGSGVDGASDGAASAATFRHPRGIALDHAGNVYVADTGNGLIRRVGADFSLVTTISGSPDRRNMPVLIDGPASAATFDDPWAIVCAGALFVADAKHDAIRVIHPELRLTSVDPARGPRAGGNSVRLLGDGFVPGRMSASFGTTSVADLTYVDGGELAAIAPAGAGGTVDVSVSNGVATATLDETYSYVVPPTITAVDPAKGPAAGGAQSTVYGTEFVIGATTVSFGSTPAAAVVVEDSMRATVTTPPVPAGPVDVVVRTEGGEAVKPAGYMFVAAPGIAGFAPPSGERGTVVTITGSNFDSAPDATVVRFGGVQAAVISATSTEMRVTVPSAASTGKISVTTSGGTATALADFIVRELRSIAVAPASAELNVAQTIQLRATAAYSDGTSHDVTNDTSWSSSNAAVATVSAGLVSAVREGGAIVDAAFRGFSATVQVTVRQPNAPPPDPATIATPLDPTRPTSFSDSIAFLHTGANAIQKNVLAGAISAQRVCVIRGRAVTPDGAPLPSVRVSVHSDTKLGFTLTRTDGAFDLAVNGGGAVVLVLEKAGFIPVHRRVMTPWRDFVTTDAVTMLPYDAAVTTVDLAQLQTIAVARGTTVADEDGQRRATLLFAPGTTASMRMPNGTTQPLSSIAVRATEQTVGANGAMPAELPPESGFTYCVELSVDEAVAAGAVSVEFSKPVAFYVENFLGFRTGSAVPVGYYDRQKGEWIASVNGRVVSVLSVTAGLAVLDVDGSGAADDGKLAALGITEDERRTLGGLYTAGQSLWRVAVTHFTPWDCNWPYTPPQDAAFPNNPEGSYEKPLEGQSCQAGSIIECESLTLGKSIRIAGTPFTLEYRSRSTEGFTAAHEIKVHVSGTTLPSSLKRIDLSLEIAGQTAQTSFDPQPNQTFTYVWNTRDVYDRVHYANRKLHVAIGFVYDGVYTEPADFDLAFAAVGRGAVTGIRSRQEIVLWQRYAVPLRGAVPDMGLGGWSIDAVHAYGPDEKMLYLGTGSQVSMEARALQPKQIGTPNLGRVHVVGPDGSVYAAPRCGQLTRVLPTGALVAVAGGGTATPAAGVIATDANLCVYDLALHSSGDPVIVDEQTRAIYRIRNGVLSVVVPAPSSPSLSYTVAVAPEGTIYFTHTGALKKVDAAGTVSTVSPTADGPPGMYHWLVRGGGDGAIYTRSTWPGYNVQATVKWSRMGTSKVIAAGGEELDDFTVDNAGRLYYRFGRGSVTDYGIRVIDPDGTQRDAPIVPRPTVNGSPVRIMPDGSFVYTDLCAGSIQRCIYVAGAPNAVAGQNVYIAALPGDNRAFKFAGSGRHSETRHSLTNTLLQRVTYDGDGHVATIEDANGRVTTVERDGDGEAVAIVAPTGERTELTIDGDGMLTNITLPGNEKHVFEYAPSGLLKTYRNPRNLASTYEYDDRGRLRKATDATGASKTLTREVDGTLTTVRVESREGHITQYEVKELGGGSVQRTVTNPDGTVLRATITPTLITETRPDGTTIRIERGADPQWGAMVPFTASTTVTAPSGQRLVTTRTRTVTLSNPNDPLTVTSVVDTVTVNGRPTTITYTAATRKVRTVSPSGRVVEEFLDGKGRTSEIRIPGFASLFTDYDSVGRLESVRRGARTYTMTWNDLDRPEGVTDALGRQVGYEWDPRGTLHRQTLPGDRVVSLGYDDNGNVTSLTPPERPAHEFEYDDVDLIAAYRAPGAEAIRYAFDDDGAPRRYALPDGTALSLDYDTAGRVRSSTSPAFVRTYSYDGSGRPASVSDSSAGQLTFGWNGFLPTQSTWAGAVAGSVSAGFGADWRLSSETVGGTGSVALSYDADGLLATAGALTLTRDPQNGMLTGTTLGGVTETIVYNEFGEVKSRTAAFGGTPLLSLAYTRDAGGRIEAIGARRFSYDAAGRLERVTVDDVPVAEYAYDANGNRLTHAWRGGTNSGTYDDQDRLLLYGDTTYEYSDGGALKSATVAGAATTYDYDIAGNLRKVRLPSDVLIDYIIDAMDRRIGKRIDGELVQGWLYADTLRIVAELDGNNQVVSRFVYGTRSNVPDYMIRGGVSYRIISDHVGSPLLVVNASDGTIAQRMEYDEFGRVLTDSNPGFQPFGFAGGLYDRDTGLLRFGARDYDPRTGRWTTREPLGFAGGSTNLYQYTFGDPVNFIDPSGFDALTADPHFQEIAIVLWTKANWGHSSHEVFAFITHDPDTGKYGCKLVPMTYEQNRFTIKKGTLVPANTVAIIHTHPNKRTSQPDDPGDVAAAVAFNKQFPEIAALYTISKRGIGKYVPGQHRGTQEETSLKFSNAGTDGCGCAQ